MEAEQGQAEPERRPEVLDDGRRDRVPRDTLRRARAKILELLLLTSTTRTSPWSRTTLRRLNLGYTKDHVKEYLAAACQLKASLDFQWNNFADKCEELKWQR